jgi:tripartite-type tricarboxylate transporter receptor subunit TctC
MRMADSLQFIVPYIKDGGSDKRMRLFAEFLAAALRRPIDVVNRTGAIIGHTAIAQAKPDGNTVGMISGEIGMMHWHPNLTSLTFRDYTALAVPFVEASAIIVRQDAPWRTLGEFLQTARDRRIKGSGSPDFGVWKFSLIRLLHAAATDFTRIDWVPTISGEEGIAKLIGGEVEVAPVPMVEAPELIFAKKIRPLATMDSVRHPLFPDVPTVKEAIGIDVVETHWRGMVGPRGLPPAITAKLIEASRDVARNPDFAEACRAHGFSVGWFFGADFAAFMQREDEEYGRVLQPYLAAFPPAAAAH